MRANLLNLISTDDSYIKQYQQILKVEEHKTMCDCEPCKLARSCAYRVMQSLHEYNRRNLLIMHSMYRDVRSMLNEA